MYAWFLFLRGMYEEFFPEKLVKPDDSPISHSDTPGRSNINGSQPCCRIHNPFAGVHCGM